MCALLAVVPPAARNAPHVPLPSLVVVLVDVVLRAPLAPTHATGLLQAVLTWPTLGGDGAGMCATALPLLVPATPPSSVTAAATAPLLLSSGTVRLLLLLLL